MPRRGAVLLLSFLFLLPLARSSDTAPLDGFSTEASATERKLEEQFRAIPNPDNMREYMRRLSARPHNVGTAYDKENAEWILSKFQEFGLDAHIESFDVLYPTPKERVVELVAPTRFVAKLQEPAVAGDPTSSQQAEQLPTYHAYSIDGDVTAPLVYVNNGLTADYERLERLGISVKGAIVIARYGPSWRGMRPKIAAEHGAIGCLVYSDPKDDGYFAGDVFPEGPMRPREGVQRGSVMDFPSSYPGNPAGGPDGSQRLAVKDSPSITKIPVLPLSYGDAQPLLAALRGPLAPREWRGALPITYHVGPGPAKVHLRVQSNWDTKPVYDVIAKIPGAVEPDQWVVRGNHHDAWVNGAQDPISGQVALLEEARALGQLLKQGWKPRRTILYCAWDGEEPMLLGSTAWGEAHADELSRHAVAYLNSDVNARGYLFFAGSHVLEHFLNGVARDIQDPETGLSAWKRHQLHDIAEAKTAEERQELRQRADLRLEALGSGTDYTVFVDHLGVPALNLGFGGEDEGGIYHSIYDDFYWFMHFSDNNFVYGRALAQTTGTAVLRLADAEILPYEFTDLADTVHLYLKQLQELLKKQQDEIRERDRELDEGVFAAASDPREPTMAPAREPVPPHLDFAPMENAADTLTRSAERYQGALARAREKMGAAIPEASLQSLNGTLLESERRLLDPQGLPRRPWYKHMLYAPGVYTGYDVKTVAGVREAIEQKRYAEADAEILRLAKVLENEAALIDEATGELEKLGK
jgi:N-acetylated-alpha-linked acidic dipeptidase